ncbi:MAG: septum formation protein Maf [Hydrogenibacillus sp.]|nr:septum formation protein Maf [Hydrogenibacillus sp.]
MKPPIVLASQSPRRAALLQMIGLPFAALPSEVSETLDPAESAEANAVRLARAKGDKIRALRPEALVLAFDTIVECEGRLFGKPENDEAAVEMLRMLSGTTHRVVSGLYAAYGTRTETAYEVTRVTFDPLSDDLIRAYVRTGEPLDKSGAYAVQGRAALFASRLEGDYYNVVGLPLYALCRLLLRLDIDLWSYIAPQSAKA